MSAVTFFVPGRPAPQGSKSFKGFRNGRDIMIESSRELGPWRERVALVAHNTMSGRKLLDGAVSVRLDFVVPRPKSAPKRGTPPAIKRPDADKLGRACGDAIAGVIIVDDAQIVDLHITKRLAEICETPGVSITVIPTVAPHEITRKTT